MRRQNPRTEQTLGLVKGALQEAARQLTMEFSRDHEPAGKITLGEWHEGEIPGHYCLDVEIDKRPFGIEFSELELARCRCETREARQDLVALLKPGLRVLLRGQTPAEWLPPVGERAAA